MHVPIVIYVALVMQGLGRFFPQGNCLVYRGRCCRTFCGVLVGPVHLSICSSLLLGIDSVVSGKGRV